MAKKGFGKSQLNEINHMVTQALDNFILKHFKKISLLKVITIEPRIVKELDTLCKPISAHPQKIKTNKSTINKNKHKEPEEIIMDNKKEYNSKTSVTKNKPSNKPIKKQSKTKDKELVGFEELESTRMKSKTYAENGLKSLGKINLHNSKGSYDKLDSSNDPSLDTLLPNPFNDPLEDFNEEPIIKKYRTIEDVTFKSKPAQKKAKKK